jgi:uncharacterized protein (TIGR03000 family)
VFAHLGKVLKATLLAVALLGLATPAQAWWHGWHGGWYGGYGYGYHGYYPGYYGYYPGYYGWHYGGYYPGYYGYRAYSYYPYYSYPYTRYYSWAPYTYYPSWTYYPYRSWASAATPVTTRTSAYVAPDGGTVSGASYGERLNDKRAHLRVKVPANAKVWLNGQATRQLRRRERDFFSPVLKPGKKYEYEVRARWKENGKTVDETKTVTVRANAWSEVDFIR